MCARPYDTMDDVNGVRIFIVTCQAEGSAKQRNPVTNFRLSWVPGLAGRPFYFPACNCFIAFQKVRVAATELNKLPGLCGGEMGWQ